MPRARIINLSLVMMLFLHKETMQMKAFTEQSSKRNKLIQNTQSTEESITNLVAAMGRLRIDEDEMEEGGADDVHELIAAMGHLSV